jgi:environmental stress-induced protein Ves
MPTTPPPGASWQILRASAHRQMAWKNGGGTTTEIAIEPPDAGLTDFDWRISMARLDAPGPFSSFPGIDRLLLALEGSIDLTIDERSTSLTPKDPPIHFAGEAQVSADLPRSSMGGFQCALDFNVMVRRGKLSAQLRRLQFERAASAMVREGVTLALARTSMVNVASLDSHAVLALNDAVLVRCTHPEQMSFSCAGAGELVICELRG